MKRQRLLQELKRYENTWASGIWSYRNRDLQEERDAVQRLIGFVENHPDCFERSLKVGHVTGSALIINPRGNQVLLTLHRKLKKWLQLGGHADGESDVEQVAKKEAQEESGLKTIELSKRWLTLAREIDAPKFFDIDIHLIPARKDEPSHYHYDIRYLLETPSPQSIRISNESEDLKWHDLGESVYELSGERSMHRQFDKLAAILKYSRN